MHPTDRPRGRARHALSQARTRFRALERADRLALLAWFSAIAVLAVLGIGITGRLHATDVLVPGTSAAKAEAVSTGAFGREQMLLVYLHGPPQSLDAEGPTIADRLAALPHFRVLDPWRAGGTALKPKPDQAILLISVSESFVDVTDDEVPRLRAMLAKLVKPPLAAYMTGYPDIDHAIHDETVSAIQRSELIAAPALLIVLVLVLGSPLAVAMPLILGGCAAGAGAGVLDLINRFTPLDISSLSLATMMGLALGVDYSLLLVARFRVELAGGASVEEASRRSAARAGRTVRFAAAVLASAMLAALIVTPGVVLKSATVGVLVAVAIAVVGASVALPPLLRWAGHDINRFQLIRSDPHQRRWAGFAFAVMRHRLLAGGLVLALMLGLAVPAFGLQTGPPDPRILPDSSPAGRDFKVIERQLGGSRAVPFVVTVVANRGTLADQRLQELASFEAELRHDPGTLAVLGPSALARRTAALASVPQRLREAGAATRSGQAGARRLERGLAKAGRGAGKLFDGLSLASGASSEIAQGTGHAEGGTQSVDAGILAAQTGAKSLEAGLATALSGTRALEGGSARLGEGSSALAKSLRAAERQTQSAIASVDTVLDTINRGHAQLEGLQGKAQAASDNAAAALAAMNEMQPAAKRDPSYQRAQSALANVVATLGTSGSSSGAPGEAGSGLLPALDAALGEIGSGAVGVESLRLDLGHLTEGLHLLAVGAGRVTAGIARLDTGSRHLRGGAQRLLGGSRQMLAGLARLSHGTGQLLGGESRLSTGSSSLSQALSGAAGGSRSLAAGIGQLHRGAQTFSKRTAHAASSIGDPGALAPLFASGYAALAAIDSAPAAQKAAASWTINVDRGGTAAHFLVVQRASYRGSHSTSLPSRADDPYRGWLQARVTRLGRKLDSTAVVGGPATSLADFDKAAKSSLPRLILVLILVTYLALALVLRSLLLPLIAVALNLLTVLASFSALAIAFGPGPLLGGPGFVDDIMVVVVFTVTFALSIDYAIFILDRTREGYRLHRTVEDGVAYGVGHTAGVITGAAAIMTAVFLAFAISPLVTMRQLGLGLTVAVILDATLVRLVLLPAVLAIVGERAWRVPRLLDRAAKRTGGGAALSAAARSRPR